MHFNFVSNYLITVKQTMVITFLGYLTIRYYNVTVVKKLLTQREHGFRKFFV